MERAKEKVVDKQNRMNSICGFEGTWKRQRKTLDNIPR